MSNPESDPPQEHPLVIEHFFKMRDSPVPVNTVAKEATLEMVVETPGHHGVKRLGGHGEHLCARVVSASIGSSSARGRIEHEEES